MDVKTLFKLVCIVGAAILLYNVLHVVILGVISSGVMSIVVGGVFGATYLSNQS